MTDDELRRLFTNEEALRDELARTAPVERIVNAIALSAERKRAQFIAVDAGHVRFWIDGEWYEELTPPPPICDHLVRRLGVMIGVLAPAKAQPRTGSIVLAVGDTRKIGMLLRIDRDDDARLRALVELVAEAELAIRDAPRTPSQHPYRR